MHIDEQTLRAYVDGELSAAHREQIEAMLEHDAERQQVVQALQASCLPYRQAFETQRLPELPSNLSDELESWLALARGSGPPPKRRRLLHLGAGIAAAFATGLWVPVPWRIDPNGVSPEPWVQAIARYQAMYVRETVEPSNADPEQTRSALAVFARRDGMRLSVPDLSSAGLSFRRIQRLSVGDAPLVQMVYLPLRGKPMALCVLQVASGDAAVSTRRLEGLSISTWHREGLAYVLVADMPSREAALLAERLAAGNVPALYATWTDKDRRVARS